MQTRFSLITLTTLAVAGAMLTGCASMHQAKGYVYGVAALSDKDIGAPVASAPVPAVSAEIVLEDAATSAVQALLASLKEPLSLTAPLKVHTLMSLNPEIVSKNRFGSVAAGYVTTALAKDGYAVGAKPSVENPGAVLRGTYVQSGRNVTITLELTRSSEKEVLGSHSFTLHVDGPMRKLLDR
jgi:hypothetical protein